MGSTTEETRAVAQQFYEAATGGGAEAMDALLAPDATWWILGHGYRDRSKFLKTLADAAAGMQSRGSIENISMRLDLITFIAEGDKAAIEFEREITWDGGGYHQNYYLGLTVSDGLVVAFREYASSGAAKKAGLYDRGLLED